MEVDKKILERLKKGDESAFESLFWQYNSHIYIILSFLSYTINHWLKILHRLFS